MALWLVKPEDEYTPPTLTLHQNPSIDDESRDTTQDLLQIHKETRIGVASLIVTFCSTYAHGYVCEVRRGLIGWGSCYCSTDDPQQIV